DVDLDLTTEITLDLEVLLDPVADRDELLVAEVLDSGVRVDAGRFECLAGARTANAENVGQCDLDALLARQIDSNETCHLVMVPLHSPRRSGTAPIRHVILSGVSRAGGVVPSGARFPASGAGSGIRTGEPERGRVLLIGVLQLSIFSWCELLCPNQRETLRRWLDQP